MEGGGGCSAFLCYIPDIATASFSPRQQSDSGLGGLEGGGGWPFSFRKKHTRIVLCFCGYENTDIWPQRRQRLTLFAFIPFSGVLTCPRRERTSTPAGSLGLKSYFYMSAVTSSVAQVNSILLQHFPKKYFPAPREPEPHLLPTCVWKQWSWRERSHRLSTRVVWRLKSPRPPALVQIHPFLAGSSLAFVEELFPNPVQLSNFNYLIIVQLKSILKYTK